ncbi:hypothetical protein OXX69_009559, partial [Metschnikowia pulcherrima]
MSDLEAQQTSTQTLPGNGKEPPQVTRVMHDDQYIHFGNERFLKSDLASAFGGEFNPGSAPMPKNNLA